MSRSTKESNIDAYIQQARLYANRGEQEKALYYYGLVLQHDPDNAFARAYLQQISQGKPAVPPPAPSNSPLATTPWQENAPQERPHTPASYRGGSPRPPYPPPHTPHPPFQDATHPASSWQPAELELPMEYEEKKPHPNSPPPAQAPYRSAGEMPAQAPYRSAGEMPAQAPYRSTGERPTQAPPPAKELPPFRFINELPTQPNALPPNETSSPSPFSHLESSSDPSNRPIFDWLKQIVEEEDPPPIAPLMLLQDPTPSPPPASTPFPIFDEETLRLHALETAAPRQRPTPAPRPLPPSQSPFPSTSPPSLEPSQLIPSQKAAPPPSQTPTATPLPKTTSPTPSPPAHSHAPTSSPPPSRQTRQIPSPSRHPSQSLQATNDADAMLARALALALAKEKKTPSSSPSTSQRAWNAPQYQRSTASQSTLPARTASQSTLPARTASQSTLPARTASQGALEKPPSQHHLDAASSPSPSSASRIALTSPLSTRQRAASASPRSKTDLASLTPEQREKLSKLVLALDSALRRDNAAPKRPLPDTSPTDADLNINKVSSIQDIASEEAPPSIPSRSVYLALPSNSVGEDEPSINYLPSHHAPSPLSPSSASLTSPPQPPSTTSSQAPAPQEAHSIEGKERELDHAAAKLTAELRASLAFFQRGGEELTTDHSALLMDEILDLLGDEGASLSNDRITALLDQALEALPTPVSSSGLHPHPLSPPEEAPSASPLPPNATDEAYEDLFKHAMSAYIRHDYRQAKMLFEECLRLQPDDQRAHYNLQRLLQREKPKT